jgi:rhodanese-related sulfurtransferase
VRALILAAMIGGCAANISSHQAHVLVQRGALLLDVRSRAEFADESLPGSVNIPIDELKTRVTELPRKPLVVYCTAGVRAGVAVPILRKAGFEVHNLGSISRWNEGR